MAPNSWVRSVVIDAEELPRQRDEAEDVVRWRLKKLLPCRPEDVRLDYIPGGEQRADARGARPRPAAGRRSRRRSRRRASSLGRIEPAALALTALLPPSATPILLAAVEDLSLALVVLTEGKPVLLRNKPLPADPERAERFIVRELGRTLAHAREQEGLAGPVDVWLAAGDPARVADVERWADAQTRGEGLHARRRCRPRAGGLRRAGRAPLVVAGYGVGGGVVMRRPNLAARPFENVRPVWVAGGALALAALVLTGVSLADFLSAHGRERAAIASLARLRARRADLVAKVEAANRQLAAVGWKKLQGETTSLEEVVARRKLVWSQLLADLERVVPWDIRLVSITPSVAKDGSLQIGLDGLATGRDAWLKLIAVLFADPKFSDPLPRSEEAPSARNGQGYRFSLTVRYWPEGRP